MRISWVAWRMMCSVWESAVATDFCTPILVINRSFLCLWIVWKWPWQRRRREPAEWHFTCVVIWLSGAWYSPKRRCVPYVPCRNFTANWELNTSHPLSARMWKQLPLPLWFHFSPSYLPQVLLEAGGVQSPSRQVDRAAVFLYGTVCTN
jgi:hypothetical protein